jgi:hypothetical protein
MTTTYPTSLAELKRSLHAGQQLDRTHSAMPDLGTVRVTVKQSRPTFFMVELPDGRQSFHTYEKAGSAKQSVESR